VGLESALRRVWETGGGPAEALLWPLSLAACGYAATVRARARAYAEGRRKAERLAVPVISVGNLAVGGTGKTPLVIALARALGERGVNVGVVTRGYKGSNEGRAPLLVSDGTRVRTDPATAGDEAVLLARELPGVPVVAGARRAEAGRTLLDAARPDVILLDDGFQHLALVRDADVVLVDGASPLGNGRVLPRGPLREPPEALARADRVIARVGEGGALPDLSRWTAAPVLAARTEVIGVLDASGAPAEPLDGVPVLGVAGIACPERFAATLSGLGAKVADFAPYPDHAPYGPSDVDALNARAARCGAVRVVTTAKDAVKLAPLWPKDGVPLHVVGVALAVQGGDAWADGLLALARGRFAARASGPTV
jgi:tetraacyldisaccharide 4'-kinase